MSKSKEEILNAIEQKGTKRREAIVDCKRIGEVKVKSLTQKEAQNIRARHQDLEDEQEMNREINKDMVLASVYSFDDEKIFDEENKELLDEAPADPDSWFNQLTDAIAYINGWSQLPADGMDVHPLYEVHDRAVEAKEAVKNDDRFEDEQLHEDIVNLLRDIEDEAQFDFDEGNLSEIEELDL